MHTLTPPHVHSYTVHIHIHTHAPSFCLFSLFLDRSLSSLSRPCAAQMSISASSTAGVVDGRPPLVTAMSLVACTYRCAHTCTHRMTNARGLVGVTAYMDLCTWLQHVGRRLTWRSGARPCTCVHASVCVTPHAKRRSANTSSWWSISAATCASPKSSVARHAWYTVYTMVPYTKYGRRRRARPGCARYICL